MIGHQLKVIYTDLDGTFIDALSYSYRESLPVLRAALKGGLAAVFCSSKTDAEIRWLLEELGLRLPFIAENGGGIMVPEGYFASDLSALPAEGSWRAIHLGAPYDELVRNLRDVRRQLGMGLRGFSDMSAEEVAAVCGFGREQGALALRRRFDEPFVLQAAGESAMGAVEGAFAQRGLRVTRGGRFFHLTGANDKGSAVRRLNRLFLGDHPSIYTVGLGDSANDIPMLAAVDRPVIVQKPGGRYDDTVLAQVPGIIRADGIGPAGWARAVTELLPPP